MNIRHSTESDRPKITNVYIDAFGKDKGDEIAELVNQLLDDETAKPVLSLVAEIDGQVIGHILFTKAYLEPENDQVTIQILAPLAICTALQSQSIGSRMIQEGLKQLKKSGVDLVFVLGHPSYYPKHGFKTAGILGFEALYPIPEEHADAWMVCELTPGVIGTVKGIVHVSKSLGQPKHWQE
ncbi:N-acetyltransferase [Okeanomitos corallinicola TIOX110]|uniref:N-acetyltransferase n=1 Tax=Okeanomitos corallinicola TIOX110 TaxID=3133117 RepID=A0ABZ2UVM1_9CYAN